jgi:hypothetical protein
VTRRKEGMEFDRFPNADAKAASVTGRAREEDGA